MAWHSHQADFPAQGLQCSTSYSCPLQGGNAPVPGAYSPAARSPREGPQPGGSTAPDASGARSTTAAGGGADAVWSRLGGDEGAAVGGGGSAAGGSAADTEAGGEAGISSRDRENMYRMYSHHVEVIINKFTECRGSAASAQLRVMC